MNFYTSVRQYGSSLLVRGVKDGIRYQEKEAYAPILFEPSKEDTGFTSLFGEKVKPVFFDDIQDAKRYLKQYEEVHNFRIFGNTSFAYQYISEKYGGMAVPHDSSQIKVAFIDIETESENGFPDPTQALEEVNVITISFRGSPVKYVFGTKPFDVDRDLASDVYTKKDDICYYSYSTETEMLRAFLAFWANESPDVISGWNIKFFDMPYLINRISRVLSNQRAMALSPWNIIMERTQKNFMGRDQLWYDIYGIEILDYFELYLKFTFERREQNNLDFIGEVELGRKKLKHPTLSSYRDIYQHDWPFWVSYNIVDVEIVQDLEDKLQLIELALTMAYDSGCNISDVFSPVRVWDTIIYNYLLQKKIVIPQKEFIEGRRIEGAYVQEIDPSAYEWIVSFDATSLYPSIIMTWNMSPETIVLDSRPITPQHLLDGARQEDARYTMAANGHMFKKDVLGVFPELIQRGFSERVEFNKKLKEYKKQLEEREHSNATKEELASIHKNISRYHVLQLNKKILLNSLYGAMANQYFRLVDYRIAEGITLTGQYIIHSVGDHIDRYLNKVCQTDTEEYVIYRDTDSVYVRLDTVLKKYMGDRQLTHAQKVEIIDRFCKDKLSKQFDEACQNIFRQTNGFEQKIQFKREVIADRGIWVGKKRYALNVHDNEGVRYAEPKTKIMGIESVRSSTPGAVRSAIAEAVRIMLQGSEEQLQAYIKEYEQTFNALPPEKIAFPRGLSGMIKYADPANIYKKGNGVATPIATRAALLYNHWVRQNNKEQQYALLRDGDKIRFIYLRMPNPLGENVIGFVGDIPSEMALSAYIDYQKMFEKAFLNPIKNIMTALRWSDRQIQTLDDLF